MATGPQAGAYTTSRTADGVRVWFHVERGNGTPRAALNASTFQVTVVKPDDSSSTSPAVSESSQVGGLYFFDVLTAFLDQEGDFGFLIKIDTKFPGASGSPHARYNISGAIKNNDTGLDNLDFLRKVLTNRRETNPTTGMLDIYNDADTAVEFSIPIYEDVGATQPYRGLGIDRQDKIV